MDFRISRDRLGIPLVEADTLDGLFAGQGYATAEDRIWQLEYDRRRAAGRLAEVTGSAAHAVADCFARRARLGELSRAGYEALDPETRALCDAHAAGVNQWLDEVAPGDTALPELARWGAPRPAPWEGWEAVAVFVIRHVTFATWQWKLWNARVLAALGARAVPLFRTEGRGVETPVIVPPGVRAATGALVEAGLFEAGAEAVAELAPLSLADSGSNAWAVHGSRTRSGQPLIAGDPHRPFESPNVYYQVRLRGVGAVADVDAAGFSFPGIPGIPHFGQTDGVAWGVTNASADYQDLYVERLPEASVDVRTETVAVSGGDPLEVECARTVHGPVVLGSTSHGVGVALASVGLEEAGRSLRCLLLQLRARTVAELDAAWVDWTEPANNVVMADVDGRIGYRTAGRIPLRSEVNNWLPVPGWTDEHDWRGHVPDAELPRTVDPPTGTVVTANQRVTPPDYPYQLGVDAAPPYRADRIWARLGDRAGLDVADMADVHTDTVCLPGLTLAALVGGPLEGWDGTMAVDSQPAALYARTFHELVRRVVARLPEALRTNPFAAWEPPATAAPPEQRVAAALNGWLAEDDRTFLPPGMSWVDEAREALAVAQADVAGRTWGDLHRYSPLVLGGTERLRVGPVAGGSQCVMANNQVGGVSTAALVGSTARYVWDLADRSRSGWVVPMGAAGDPDGPHGRDQFDAWRTGQLFPVFASD